MVQVNVEIKTTTLCLQAMLQLPYRAEGYNSQEVLEAILINHPQRLVNDINGRKAVGAALKRLADQNQLDQPDNTNYRTTFNTNVAFDQF